MPAIPTSTTSRRDSKSPGKKPPEFQISRVRRPDQMSLEEWQVRLRRQFGREQPFHLENLGSEPVLSGRR